MLQSNGDDIVGQVDGCRPNHEFGFFDGRAILLPAEHVRIQGWVWRRGGDVRVEAIVAGARIPLARSVRRPDVAVRLGDESIDCGFEATLAFPEGPPGPFDPQVVACCGEREVRLDVSSGLIRTSPRIPAPPAFANAQFESRIRSIADADPAPMPTGWSGRRTVRPRRPIGITGWALYRDDQPPPSVSILIEGRRGQRAHFPAARRRDGEATAVSARGTWFEAGFVCVLGPDELEPGLYNAVVVVHDDTGQAIRGSSTLFHVAASELPQGSQYLPLSRSRMLGALESCAPDTIRATEPVAVTGWAMDPATKRGAEVYTRFDDGPILPIPSLLPRGDGAMERTHFEGVADTTTLETGPHRLRVLAEPTYAGFWYVLDDREIVVQAD